MIQVQVCVKQTHSFHFHFTARVTLNLNEACADLTCLKSLTLQNGVKYEQIIRRESDNKLYLAPLCCQAETRMKYLTDIYDT